MWHTTRSIRMRSQRSSVSRYSAGDHCRRADLDDDAVDTASQLGGVARCRISSTRLIKGPPRGEQTLYLLVAADLLVDVSLQRYRQV